jgi:hypothetical protein
MLLELAVVLLKVVGKHIEAVETIEVQFVPGDQRIVLLDFLGSGHGIVARAGECGVV